MSEALFLLARLVAEMGIIFVAECAALFFVLKWHAASTLPGIRWFIVAAVCNIITSLFRIPWVVAYVRFIFDPTGFGGWPDENAFLHLIAHAINVLAHAGWLIGAAKLWSYTRAVRITSPAGGSGAV